MTLSVSDAIRALLRERPGLTAPQILEALPRAKHQLRTMAMKGLLTSSGPRGRMRYFVPTEEEEARRKASIPERRYSSRDAPRPGRQPSRAPATYEYMELKRASAEGLSTFGSRGWRVVAGQLEDRRVTFGGDLDEGWTVLLERTS